MTRRSLGVPAFVALALVSLSQCAASCTDGVTPDCSDAAAQCGPDLGEAGASTTPDTAPESGGGDAGSEDADVGDADAAPG